MATLSLMRLEIVATQAADSDLSGPALAGPFRFEVTNGQPLAGSIMAGQAVPVSLPWGSIGTPKAVVLVCYNTFKVLTPADVLIDTIEGNTTGAPAIFIEASSTSVQKFKVQGTAEAPVEIYFVLFGTS